MSGGLKIKVCGMRGSANVREVAELCPDYMGFIVFDRSPRCCRGIPCEVIAGLPPEVTPVLVTVDMPEEELTGLADSLGISTLQLHGSESALLCRRLRGKGFKVWKAVRLASAADVDGLAEYADAVDAFLFDTPSSGYGGSGRKFDWTLLRNYVLPVDFFLSGGIGPDDAGAIARMRHPRFAGIDLNSRFEVSPGVKDVRRLKQFIEQLTEASTASYPYI